MYVPDNYDDFDSHEREIGRYQRLYMKRKHEEEDIEMEELEYYINTKEATKNIKQE